MSFDDYARHIKLKYGLATALAVIKTKPENLSVKEYIASLREKLKTADQMDVDFELSLGSDEFDITDEDDAESRDRTLVLPQTEPLTRERNESPTILRDFNPDDLLLTHKDCDRQPTSFTIDEALILLEEMDREVPFTTSNAVAVELSQNLLLPIENTTQNMSTYTQLTCLDTTTQLVDRTNNIRDNITKFLCDIETDNNQMTIENGKVGVDNQVTVQTNEEILGSADGKDAINVPKEGNVKKTKDSTKAQVIDTQETQLYTLSDYTQNTHFSQSQVEDSRFIALDKYITRVGKTNNNTVELNAAKPVKTNEMAISNNKDKFTESTQDCLDLDLEIGKIKDLDMDIEIDKIKDAPCVGYYAESAHNSERRTLEINKILLDTTSNAGKGRNTKDTFFQNRENASTTPQNIEIFSNDSEEEAFNSQSKTTIPFKIIEELNRVRSTFNRRTERKVSTDSFSTDSGYRTDSQGKSCWSGLQSSGNWVNQSAYTLYDYLLTCPLTSTTAEITKEISQVLGDLVDKLHAEEKYPSFLDEVIGSIDAFLAHLSLGGGCDETAMGEKDESIQRTLLLNTSVHVIKSTLEKIATKLEQLHKSITTEADIIEITDIHSLENTAYIFHTLEVLLQRYVKKKAVLASQPSSQASEEDKLPKRSSLTDLWKQKWDPEFKRKDSLMYPRSDVKCVDMKIGEVLNKLVIDCMEGYSLVSFAALQCFNVLQS